MTRIKRMLALAAVLAGMTIAPAPLVPQQPAQVPEAASVRVWNGGQFVDDLTLQDFELFENGQPVPAESLYLVHKDSVVRKEGGQDFQPNVARKYYFLFQVLDYNPKLAEGIRHLFLKVIQPGDSLEIQTPMKLYRLTPQAMARLSKEALAKELNDTLKRDITAGALVYKGLMGDLKRIVRAIQGTEMQAPIGEEGVEESTDFGLELLLPQYQDSLQKLESLRAVDERKILGFAQILKKQPGQKFVFFVYQREFRPEINQKVYQSIFSAYQDRPDILAKVQELFQFSSRNVSLNADRVKAALADSAVNFNFLFMNKTPETFSGIVMREQSQDVFKMFSDIARNSGGVIETSQDPGISIINALDLSERYYLLYYFPGPAGKEGTPGTLDVKIKGKDYQVTFFRGRLS